LRLLFVGDICDAAAPRLAADAHRRLAAARPWTTDCERGTDFATSSVQPLVARLGLYFDEVFFFSESRFISFPGTEIVTDDRVPAADRFIVSLVPKLSPTTGSLRLTVSSFLTVIGTEFFTDDRVPVAIYS
jgi:hypothetical protein